MSYHYYYDRLKKYRNNKTRKRLNNQAKFDKKLESFKAQYHEYISIIQTIYNQDNLDNKNSSELDVFKKLYKTTLDYREKILKNSANANDFYYVNTHGSFGDFNVVLNQIYKVPDNTVLIFLTPINRYGFICSKSEGELIKDSLHLPENRKFIQENLDCLDKFNNDTNSTELSTKNMKYHKMFKNALFLYPGQYYFSLDLGINFDGSDKGRDMNIHYFTKDEEVKNLIKKEKKIYEDQLHNIVNDEKNSEIYEKEERNSLIKYIIVDCCRNLDSAFNSKLSNTYNTRKIYLYENFMFYYNLIMANCKIINYNTFLPDIRFSNMKGYASFLLNNKYFKIFFEKYLITFLGNFKTFISDEKTKEFVKDLLPEIFENLPNHVISDSIQKLEIMYEDDNVNGVFQINYLYMIRDIYNYTKDKKIKNNEMLDFLYVFNLFINIFKLLKLIKEQIESDEVNDNMESNKEFINYISQPVLENNNTILDSEQIQKIREIIDILIKIIDNCTSYDKKKKDKLLTEIKILDKNYFLKVILELFAKNGKSYLGRMELFKIKLINNFMKTNPNYVSS